jgi:hypothetical protein
LPEEAEDYYEEYQSLELELGRRILQAFSEYKLQNLLFEPAFLLRGSKRKLVRKK